MLFHYNITRSGRTPCQLIIFLIGLIQLSCLNFAAGQGKQELENDLYQIHVLENGSLELTVKGSPDKHLFAPAFTIMYRENDPGLQILGDRKVRFKVPGWKDQEGNDVTDFFKAGSAIKLQASSAAVEGNKIIWSFPTSNDYSLEAELSLPPGKEDPRIRYRLKAVKPGWYSAGYTGAPETAPEEINELWQPLVWQERRFPYKSFLSAEFMCSIPAVLLNRDGYTTGVVADPSEIPFRFQTSDNSRFGLLLRNEEGNAQPMIFAPVPGQSASALQTGDTVDFCLRLIVRKERLFDTYQYIATRIFGFHDYRKNAACSLNETLENMIDYAMNDVYSGWNAELKAPDYSTDVRGTVKLVSALHPLSIAMVTDNEQIYKRRALPMIEYLMSREKYLFSTDTSAKHQSPSHYLKGPAAEVSELAALYEMSGKRSTVFRHYAEELYDQPRVLNLNMVSKGASWQNSLALYRMSGKQEYLDAAKEGADNYIAERINTLQTDFSDVHIEAGGQFWTDYSPKWIDLLELYEETKDKKYLAAARRGAELFVEYIWMQPVPPDTMIKINEGGKVGTYAHQNRLNEHVEPMKAPEQMVPAWRLSQTGLISEASTTYTANRAVFLSHHAAYLLRLAHYTGESFFHDIARAAIVGRYANFPGYSIMGEYTTIYGRPDYPLRSLNEVTYNNIYYNHIWPQIALLMDFLVSEAFTRSEGKINFPHQYAQGYAYLQSKVYGGRKGKFYEDENVQLWMPRRLLRTDNIQGNYLAGYGNGNLYLALMNQAPRDATVTVYLNPDLVPFEKGRSYQLRVWVENQPASPATMRDGKITIPLKGHGITAIAIEELPLSTQFLDKIQHEASSLPEQSYSQTETPLGNVTGMIISLGTSLTNAYIWLQTTEKELKEAKLQYKYKGEWKELTDKSYPYEFSVPLSVEQKVFEYRVEGTDINGKQLQAENVKLMSGLK